MPPLKVIVTGALSSQPADPLPKPTWLPTAPELGTRISGSPAAGVGVGVRVALGLGVAVAVNVGVGGGVAVEVGVIDGVAVVVGVGVERLAEVTVNSVEPVLPSMSVTVTE